MTKNSSNYELRKALLKAQRQLLSAYNEAMDKGNFLITDSDAEQSIFYACMVDIPEVADDRELCALCEKDHTDNSSTIRYLRLNNNKEFVDGYYKPNSLGSDEKYELGQGEHGICSDRQACLKRQERNRIINFRTPAAKALYNEYGDNDG